MAFEVVSLRATELMMAHPALFGRLMLSRATLDSASCVVTPAERAQQDAGGATAKDARLAAWLIGLSVGRDAVARQWGADAGALASMGNERTRFAQMVGVPPPRTFSPGNAAETNSDFRAFIEGDPAGTAHSFAVRYAPEACHLYKLGALWGYSMLVRPMLPGERAVFALEIHHHAGRTSLPREIWQPMFERTDADATREELQSETAALTTSLTSYLMSQP